MGNSLSPTSLPGLFKSQLRRRAFATQSLSGILHSGENYDMSRRSRWPARHRKSLRCGSYVPRDRSGGRGDQGGREAARARVHSQFLCQLCPQCSSPHLKAKVRACLEDNLRSSHLRILIGGIAGVQQATINFSGYGQGAQGYGKRYGADYADLLTGTFIGSAILPSLLKQDPRYFYKGTGSTRSRILYAIANAVICKGDNRALAGKLLQYPRKPRRGRYLKSLLSGGGSQWSGIDV